MKDVVDFLDNLKHNNNRDWFNSHKDWYEKSRQKVLFLTELIINEVRKFDEDIPITDPKDCLFRIYRDVRFSADKSPYKTHFGSYIAKGGRSSTRAGYYFHIDPDASFIGGGIYMPGPDVLKALRTAIYDQPDTFLEIIEDPGFKNIYPTIDGEKLKTAPKGFPPDFQHIDLLKYKSYAFTSEISTSDVIHEDFVNTIVERFQILHHANRFLNESIDQYL